MPGDAPDYHCATTARPLREHPRVVYAGAGIARTGGHRRADVARLFLVALAAEHGSMVFYVFLVFHTQKA